MCLEKIFKVYVAKYKNISNYTFEIILEFALKRIKQDYGALSHGFAYLKGKLILSLSQSCIFNSDLLVVLRIFA